MIARGTHIDRISPIKHALARGEAWTIAAVATLVMSVSYADRQVLAAIATGVQAALHIDDEAYGWLQGAFSFAYLAGAPLAGVLIDRVGARRGLLVSVVLWSIVAMAHALAPTFAILLTLRVLLGATEAPSFPGAAQAVRRALAPEDRAAGIGLLFTGSSVGAMVAAPLALLLEARYGWRVAFAGSAVAGLLWVPAWIAATRSRAARSVLAAQGPTERPTSRIRLLGDPAVLRALLLVLASAPVTMFVLLWYPKYLSASFHLTHSELAGYLWIPPLFLDLGAVGMGALASAREGASFFPFRTRAPAPRLPGPRSHADLVVMAGFAAAALLAVPYVRAPWAVVFLGACAMMGGGALYARLTADMLARVDPAHVSTAGGLTAAAQSLAYIVANPLVGRTVQAQGVHGYHVVLTLLGTLPIPGALIWIAWRTKK